METEQSDTTVNTNSDPLMKLLFVEIGVGYDQHGYFIICPFRSFISTVLYSDWFCFKHCSLKTIVIFAQYMQDITAAAMRACRDAISSNSIPAFRRGAHFSVLCLVV
ncbi:hypothetical protein HS088_TW21G00865 [Tripterygium wilfordii]|uniref:Uncharacterized protein n=1 Tax=Tripterygium wilfordii TaxID=458696 RepID=A0A7J7C449_TRIWF|nr:hypothetical protein HS088_TW21G00865 [Tripterygium wilfordii]